MKKVLKYIIILAVSMVLTLLYGFCIGGEPSLWFVGLQIAVAVLIMIHFNKKSQYESNALKIIKTVITAVVVFVFSIVFYAGVSMSSMTLVNTYETKVTNITFSSSQRSRGQATIYFNTPDGQEDFILVPADASLVYPDGPPSPGDKITIGVYEGLFGDIYMEYLGQN